VIPSKKRLLFKSAAVVAAMGAATAIGFIAGGEGRDEPTIPLAEFMGHVMQRNAMQLWAWTELEITSEGERWSKPVSAEDWENAESDALTLRSLSSALEKPPYAIDDRRWEQRLVQFQAATTVSAKAAEAKDFPALVKAGEGINDSCVACHLTFAPQLEAKPPQVPLPPR
jgi:hypothetical protein